MNGYISLPTAHTFRFFSPTWDYFPSISQNMFSDLISLPLFLRSGIHLRFTASMLVLLFIASQIRYHQCEAKMKRSQISVRRKISGLLCVKSTSFSFLFFFQVRHLKPIFKPVRNNNVSTILVYAPVRNIPAKLAGYKIVFVEANPTDILQILGTT